MAVIQSFGNLETVNNPYYAGIRRSNVRLYNEFYYDYASLYRIQPNVRVCVDFLARNMAQLGVHQFERIDENDRKRIHDFGMTLLLSVPMPPKYKVTRYRFFEAMVSDLGIYFNSFHLKIRDPETGFPVALLRIPPPFIYAEGGLVNSYYQLEFGNLRKEIDPEDILHIRGYNPENSINGLSPLETLRRVLAEEDAAGRNRRDFWNNSARMEGFIERPESAPEWKQETRERFISEFNDLYSGDGSGGKTAVLEEGMRWVPAGYNARESEYLGGRLLTRTECARSYHIPLTAVGILEHATLTNIREQHDQLYQDCLGPIAAMIEGDLDLQLKPDFEGYPGYPDIDSIYTEFNIYEKLQGNFEDQIKALQSAIGRPFMVPDEGRARFNLPALGGDAAQLATPLNVLIGGQASPRDSDPNKSFRGAELKKKTFAVNNAELRERFRLKWVEVLSRNYQRQASAITSRVNPAIEGEKNRKGDLGGGVWWDAERWDRELAEDLLKLNLLTALTWGDLIFEQTGVRLNRPEAFEERMIPYLEEHSRIQAEEINRLTQDQISEALEKPDPLGAVKDVFKVALTVRVISQSISGLTLASNFGAHEAATASGLASKTWRVTSGNPRESHAALDGVSVGIRETFSNGLRWPGDPTGPAEELAGCQCIVEFEK